jgi:hypothetical protein
MPNRKRLLGYLEWALDGLGLELAFQLIRPSHVYLDKYVGVPSDHPLLSEFDKTVSPVLAIYLKDDPLPILSQAGSRFSSLLDENVSPASEIFSYHRMLAAIVASLRGDRIGLEWLGALLITEPINRKLAITYFLGNLTDGSVGTKNKVIPTKAQVVEWTDQIRTHSITLTPLIAKLAFVPEVKG